MPVSIDATLAETRRAVGNVGRRGIRPVGNRGASGRNERNIVVSREMRYAGRAMTTPIAARRSVIPDKCLSSRCLLERACDSFTRFRRTDERSPQCFEIRTPSHKSDNCEEHIGMATVVAEFGKIFPRTW